MSEDGLVWVALAVAGTRSTELVNDDIKLFYSRECLSDLSFSIDGVVS